MFSPQELAYIHSQPLLRLATVSADGQPDADVVAFQWDGQRFVIGGYTLPQTRKFKNVEAGQRRVSLIIDDLASVSPWTPRGIKVHGIATIEEQGGGSRLHLAVAPLVSWSWGILGPSFRDGKFAPSKIVWTGGAT